MASSCSILFYLGLCSVCLADHFLYDTLSFLGLFYIFSSLLTLTSTFG